MSDCQLFGYWAETSQSGSQSQNWRWFTSLKEITQLHWLFCVNIPIRWCPIISSVGLYKYYNIYNRVYTSIVNWDCKLTYNWGGTTLQWLMLTTIAPEDRRYVLQKRPAGATWAGTIHSVCAWPSVAGMEKLTGHHDQNTWDFTCKHGGTMSNTCRGQ